MCIFDSLTRISTGSMIEGVEGGNRACIFDSLTRISTGSMIEGVEGGNRACGQVMTKAGHGFTVPLHCSDSELYKAKGR